MQLESKLEFVENWENVPFEKILELYRIVNWSNYSDDPESLKKAFEYSTSVTIAMEDQEIVGLVRSISDKVSIHYLQDILVHPDHQRKGIGRKLFERTLDRYKEVRTHMLLTDDEEKQRAFYESLGFKNTGDLKDVVLNSFIKMKDVKLS